MGGVGVRSGCEVGEVVGVGAAGFGGAGACCGRGAFEVHQLPVWPVRVSVAVVPVIAVAVSVAAVVLKAATPMLVVQAEFE